MKITNGNVPLTEEYLQIVDIWDRIAFSLSFSEKKREENAKSSRTYDSM